MSANEKSLSSENSGIVAPKVEEPIKEVTVKKGVITSEDLFSGEKKKRFYVHGVTGIFGNVTRFSDQFISGDVDSAGAEQIKKDYPFALEIDENGKPIEDK